MFFSAALALSWRTSGMVFPSWPQRPAKKPKQALAVVLSVLILISGSAFVYRHYHEAQQALSAHQARLNELGEEQEKFAHQAKGEVFIPQSLPTARDYRDPYKKLRDAGFTDITLDPKKDLVLGHFESENAIVEITVDGSPIFDTGVWIKADTPIVITYHTFLWKRTPSAKSCPRTFPVRKGRHPVKE